MTIVGIANKNPWNVKSLNHNNPWKGTAGYDHAGHVIFHHVIFAIRAVCRDIASKYLGGATSLYKIMDRYSPASDTLGSIEGNEHNNPMAAANMIARQMGGISIDDDVMLFNKDGSPVSNDRLCCFLEALFHQECGWTERPPSRIMLLSGIEDYVRDFVK